MDADTSPITLDQLRVLVAIVEHGSFSAAARALHRAQSAVSYAVANLERQLDVELFDRSRHRPTLTEAGQALLLDARATLRDADRLRARARSMAAGSEPRVSLAVSALFPMPDLVRTIDAFRGQFPHVALVLHTEALGGVAALVDQGVCSIGVSEPLPPAMSSLESAPLGTVPLVHVVAPSHPLAAIRGPIARERLEEHIQLVLSDRSGLTEGIDHGVLGGPTWRLADLGAKHAFLLAGFGWGGMPLHLVEGDVAAGRLARIAGADEALLAFKVPLYGVHRVAAPPGPAGRWLLDRLAGSCARAAAARPQRAGAAPGRAAKSARSGVRRVS